MSFRALKLSKLTKASVCLVQEFDNIIFIVLIFFQLEIKLYAFGNMFGKLFYPFTKNNQMHTQLNWDFKRQGIQRLVLKGGDPHLLWGRNAQNDLMD